MLDHSKEIGYYLWRVILSLILFIYISFRSSPDTKSLGTDEAKIALDISRELLRYSFEVVVVIDEHFNVNRHVWLDVEIKLSQAGVKTRLNGIVSDLVSSYQGQTLAYDEGIPFDPIILYTF